MVQISGLGSGATGTVYALETTFDNRINVCLDGETDGTLPHEEPLLCIAQLVNGQWTAPSGTNETPPVPGAARFVGLPLNTFLSEELAKGVSLDSLVGDWGVDGSLVPSTPTYRSWEIVRGGGVFAVVPEPSAIALLGMALVGLLAAAWGRVAGRGLRRRFGSVQP